MERKRVTIKELYDRFVVEPDETGRALRWNEIGELWTHKEMLFAHGGGRMIQLFISIANSREAADPVLKEIAIRAETKMSDTEIGAALAKSFMENLIATIAKNPKAGSETLSICFTRCENDILVYSGAVKSIVSNPMVSATLLEEVSAKILAISGMRDALTGKAAEFGRRIESLSDDLERSADMGDELKSIIRDALPYLSEVASRTVARELERTDAILEAIITNPAVEAGALHNLTVFETSGTTDKNRLLVKLIYHPRLAYEDLELIYGSGVSPIIKELAGGKLDERKQLPEQ